MKRIHVWTLLGVAGAGLLAALLGPTVWGQPEGNLPFPLPPELMTPPKVVSDQATEIPVLPAPSLSSPRSRRNRCSRGPRRRFSEQAQCAPAASTAKRQDRSANVPTAQQQPAVSIEWIGPTAARIHQPMPCQILVRNASNVPAHNVIVRHRLGQGVVVKACEPKGVNEDHELIWNLGTLAPDQTHRIDLTLLARVARGDELPGVGDIHRGRRPAGANPRTDAGRQDAAAGESGCRRKRHVPGGRQQSRRR